VTGAGAPRRSPSANGTIVYLFDIDGTLLHGRRSGRDALDAAFVALHGVPEASAGVRFGGKTDPVIVDEIFAARLGRAPTPNERAACLDAYVPRVCAHLATGGVDVLPGVRDALERLAVRPEVRLGIATGNVRAGADAKLAAAELTAFFSFGGYACDSPVRAELVAIARARGSAGVRDVREVVVVGDTIFDIAAARACGATAVAVATGADSADALAHADAVLASMSELLAWHEARFA
jgi:phosphoglycolate phosphatase-like HAD superfamily hydrolase